MESIRELYRIGVGPSSSHTMAPRLAAERFKARCPHAVSYRVTLFGSLAATGKGHLTDVVILEALAPAPVSILWKPEQTLPFHPNGMRFEALDDSGRASETWEVYSVGGGALREDAAEPCDSLYQLRNMRAVLDHCERGGLRLWQYVEQCEDDGLWDFLRQVWHAMQRAIERGVRTDGILPGGLGLRRKARLFYERAGTAVPEFGRTSLVAAYALAVGEENASGGTVVTAPTCGSSGVLPAVLRYLQEKADLDEESVLRSLATAGLVGNIIKHNASISGAEVGCQGEIGASCAMAAAAAAQLLGATLRQIEYAAEMGLEHHLGLTCDPVAGLVQIPCIERNAFAAARALTCAEYALLSDSYHVIPFDEVVEAMNQTGHDLPSIYRETAAGGLAAAHRRHEGDEKR